MRLGPANSENFIFDLALRSPFTIFVLSQIFHTHHKMTSENTEKDNLLAPQAEGQMPSRPQTAAVNDQTPAEQLAQKEEITVQTSAEQPAEEETPLAAEQPAEEESTTAAAQTSVPDAPVSDQQSAEEKHPAKDYSQLSPDELVAELDTLLKEQPIQHIGRQARSLREAFDAQVASRAKTESEGEENPSPEKPSETEQALAKAREHFDALWTDYRKKREQFAAQMAVEQKANLEERLALIEELKNLIEKEENASIREFHNIQARWRKCGMVPREQSSAVWQTYQHHVERFFDYLKLNREFRDMEFERNLAEKNKIIARAEELMNEPSVKKAFEELQMLHRLWKEETGPVAADQREAVWERFSAATRAIHERRHQFLRQQKEILKANLEAKLAVCQKIEDLAAQGASSHDGWQKKMAEVEALKEQFKAIGIVPENRNSEIWDRFKEVNRKFNQAKNAYYKELKRSQMSNLEKKTRLVEQAEALKDSTDWTETAAALKSLQAQWKEIGHVPRQKSDDLWARFRAACNYFFENMGAQRKNGDAQMQANLEQKEQLLAQAEAFAPGEDPNADIETLKTLSSAWRAAGRVPYAARRIEDKFNALIDSYFEKLKVSRNDIAMIHFKDKVDQLAAEGNKQKFYAEMDFVRRKIDEITREVQRLKNNIEFFSSASTDNPLVREVNRNIERKSQALEQWKEKLAYMRQIQL